MTTSDIHPCFEPQTRRCSGIIHVPVAPECPVGCVYCAHRMHGNLSCAPLPGHAELCVTSQQEISDYLQRETAAHPDIRILGVSGPGDPLSNPGSMAAFFEVARHLYPGYRLCLCTSGHRFDQMRDLLFAQPRLGHISFTINAVTLPTATRIYFTGHPDRPTACRRLLDQQMRALRECVDRGLRVKVNTVLLPDVNSAEVLDMSRLCRELGVAIFNLIRLKETFGPPARPDGADRARYNRLYADKLREIAATEMCVKTNCRQCRADYSGCV